jgi:hypothetical protein
MHGYPYYTDDKRIVREPLTGAAAHADKRFVRDRQSVIMAMNALFANRQLIRHGIMNP